ncbi:MAG: cyclic nucleotide-binding domain-containing protein [Anaerolineae bacterium]|nr:cyclic nucleotide-binding domain-containing protein [Anaerolineae bacterium]
MPNLSRQHYLNLLFPILRGQEAFTDFSDEELARFAEAAEFRFCEQGTRIIEQGQRGNEFFVVLNGQLRAVDVNYDPPRLLNYHDAGHIIGARALLTNERRAATVEVVVDARVAIFDKGDWDWLLHRQPRIETYFQNLESEFSKRALIDFPGRQWDEVVVASTKRHVLAFIAKLSLPLTLLILPLIFLIIAELVGIRFFSVTSGDLLLMVLAILPFILLAVGLTVYHYIDWRNDDFILTTKRFIHIERRLFYGEQRDEAPLTRIQDVWLAYPGFLDRFDYFHLRIKTAGAGDIRIKGITKAQQIKDQIFLEKERALARVRAAHVAAIRQLLAQELNWEETLEETILAIAETEGGMTTRPESYRSSFGVLNYFWPRVQNIEPDGVTITWRKHYWVYLQTVGLPLLAFLVSLYLFLATLVVWFPFGVVAGPFIQIGLGIAVAVSFLWYLWLYDGWRRDIYQVTRNRILDVTSSPFGLGGEIRSEGNLDDIQNITYEIPDLFSALINMGTVIIETAGTKDTFTFKKVLNPSSVQQEIFNRMVLVQQREREQRRDATTRDLLRVFAEYQHLLEKASAKGLVSLGQQPSNLP